MTDKGIDKIIKANIQMVGFISLVKRMREAQEELDVFESENDSFEYETIMKRKELTSKVIRLESEVDEWLEKLNK